MAESAALIIAGGMALLFIAAIVFRIERWPLSAYPMFAHRGAPAGVRTYRVRLEYDDAPAVLFRPHFYYEGIYFSGAVAALVQRTDLDTAERDAAIMSVTGRFVRYALATGEARPSGLRRAVLVERCVMRDLGDDFELSERDLAVLDLSDEPPVVQAR